MKREPDHYDELQRPLYEATIPDTDIPVYLLVEYYRPGMKEIAPLIDGNGDLVKVGEPSEPEELEFSVLDEDMKPIEKSLDFCEIMDLEDILLNMIRGQKSFRRV